MKLYKLFLISVLFLVSVGGVCATEPYNSTTEKISINDSDLTFSGKSEPVLYSNNTDIDDSVD